MLINGNYFAGLWSRNKRNGYGVLQTKEETYFGEFFNDEQHGFGVYTTVDGENYEGQWKFGMQNGKGKYTWSDKSYYDGKNIFFKYFIFIFYLYLFI